MIKLPKQQRDVIKTFVRTKVKGEFQDTENTALNRYVKQLQKDYPEAFQDDTSQRLRVFFDEPHTEVPHARSIRKEHKEYRNALLTADIKQRMGT